MLDKKLYSFQKIKKRGLLTVLVVVFLFPVVFASGDATQESNKGINQIITALYVAIDLFSWLWIVVGNLAGKLMTNAFVYGEFMNLDIYLRKIWQIVRTFTNFGIGFLFIYYIGNHILRSWRGDQKSTIKDDIVKLFLASIFVQMSRFLVMAVVDVSTILMATVSAFPSQVVTQQKELRDSFQKELLNNEVFSAGIEGSVVRLNSRRSSSIEGKPAISLVPIVKDGEGEGAISREQLFDNILPRTNSLSGPLVYLGFSIFKVQDFTTFFTQKQAITTLDAFMKEFLTIALHAGLIILYTIALLVLLVVNIVRVLTLRLLIVTSPLLILFSLIGKGAIFKGKKGVLELLNLKTMLQIIFKPVLFALFISLALIVIVLFQSLMEKHEPKFSGTQMSHYDVIVDGKDKKSYVSEAKVDGLFSMVVYQGTKTIGQILTAFLALFLMRMLIKIAISSKTGISSLDSFTENVSGLVGTAMGSIPLIPTSQGMVGFNAVWDENSSPIGERFKANSKINQQLKQRESDSELNISKALGISDGIRRTFSLGVQNELKRLAKKNTERKSGDFGALISSLKRENRGVYIADIEDSLFNWIKMGAWNPAELKALGIDTIYTELERAETKDGFFTSLLRDQTIKTTFLKKALGITSGDVHSYQNFHKAKINEKGELSFR